VPPGRADATDVFPRILTLACALVVLFIVPAAAHATAFPSSWCGDERAADYPGATDGLAVIHAVYAVPADAPSRLQSVAPGIQADAGAASGILERARGRAVRFDRGTTCGTRYLDITTVRLPQTTAQLQRLAQTDNGTLDAVTQDLSDAGLPTAEPGDAPKVRAARLRDFVVWLDGPYPETSCGQSDLNLDRRRSQDNLNNGGGKLALIFRDGDGFCGPTTVLHELGHTLGAVQPRPGQTDWDGHCHDDVADIMCNLADTEAQVDARVDVDSGSDDYWDPPAGPPLTWWTLDESRFICADTTCSTPTASASRARASRTRAAEARRHRTAATRTPRAV
jgi:hypothetical protein